MDSPATKTSYVSRSLSGVTWPLQTMGMGLSCPGSKRQPSRSTVNPAAARWKAMAWRQPSNIKVPGMHGSSGKWPSKNQSSGETGVSARR